MAEGDSLESKSVSVKDVTTQYIDMNTRLANNKALEKRYLELLSKANKMTDVLAIESKLNEIRTNIESAQGQFNYLNKQIAYSSLSITFYTETPDTVKPNGTGNKLLDALIDGWHWAVGLFFDLISLWPLWLVVIVLALMYKRWRKRRKMAH